MPRLVICHVCHSLTRIPDPPSKAPLVPAHIAWMEDGKEQEYMFRDAGGQPFMVAQYDPALEDWVERHSHDDRHDLTDQQKWEIAVIDKLSWETTEVCKQIGAELSQLNGAMYTERDQLKEDALKCFGDHHRPKDTCPDVFSDSKLVGNHESNKNVPKDQRMYLCHLCPFVHGVVIPQVRHAKGFDAADPVTARRNVLRDQQRQQRRAMNRLRGGR
jgi:hypothetical protein